MPVITQSRIVVWSAAAEAAKALDVLFDDSDIVARRWMPTMVGGDLWLGCLFANGGGANPTSVEIVVLISYDDGVTAEILSPVNWVSTGIVDCTAAGQIRIPWAAVGSGIVAIRHLIGPLPVPAGCHYSIQAKRTGGAAVNTLLVTSSLDEV